MGHDMEGVPTEMREMGVRGSGSNPSRKKKLGLIVNPIAGMGGAVGLKGTDGEAILTRARELGATPIAPTRAIEALGEIVPLMGDMDLITSPHDMGENEARACGFDPMVVGSAINGKTTADDTKNAAREMLKLGVDLLLFAGGDGTARDIYEAVHDQLPVLGIPTGVKMHSGVLAINPRAAGELAGLFLQGKVGVCEGEVMDIDEEAFRQNRLSAKLYGYLKVPCERQMVQNAKIGSVTTEREALEGIAWYIIDDMRDDYIYVIGPGTTTKTIMEKLGLEYTLLGVDIIQKGNTLALDVNESQLLGFVRGKRAKIIVTPIGGQGFIFGRGNQQISPEVIRLVGGDNILIVATETKIVSLEGDPLLVDTGNNEVNELLKGYVKVITGYGKAIIYRVS